MDKSYRVVVIGGGVVGASVLYHLSKLGWSDIVLVERAELTAGSTWHAAAGFHVYNSDPHLTALQDYTISLYREIERESGQDCGIHVNGGISLATTPERHDVLKAEFSAFKAVGITTARLVSVPEIQELTHGIIQTDDVLGGLYDSQQGFLDPSGATHAYVRSAQKRGASLILRNRVVELKLRSDGEWDVVTEGGTIRAEHVINAAGLWAKKVGLMAGVDLPVTPMEHHYVVTEALPSVKEHGYTLPTLVDVDRSTYSRQEGQGLLMGLYESRPLHWHMEGAPWDYGMDLIPENIDLVGDELQHGFTRYPELAHVGIRRWVNGGFTFAPDGNPLVGPCGPNGYWVACGVMAGFSQGGGVGKSLAEWIVHGETEDDVFGMDVARFGPHHSNKKFIKQTTAQFYRRRMKLTFANEELPGGRKLMATGAHIDMDTARARWGNSWGMEVPLYYAPSTDFEEPGTMRRSADFPIVGEECKAVQESVGLAEISSYSRYRVRGPNARNWLDRLLACRLPGAGKLRLAPMLGVSGRLKGDLTCLNWDDDEYWLMGSFYLRAWHMRWFRQHLIPGVILEDISDEMGGLAITGPKSRELLQGLTRIDLSEVKMMNCVAADIGLHRVRIGRLSLTGEQTFELNCASIEQGQLYRILIAAGREYGIRRIGVRAVLSMRLEKSIGIWSAEFSQAYTPAMTGLDRWIDWQKEDFIGRKAAAEARNPDRTLTMLRIDAKDADSLGFEPVYKNGRTVGMTTSGGYGHRVGLSLAMALVDVHYSEVGTELVVDIAGEPTTVQVIPMSPYDPEGKRMRM